MTDLIENVTDPDEGIITVDGKPFEEWVREQETEKKSEGSQTQTTDVGGTLEKVVNIVDEQDGGIEKMKKKPQFDDGTSSSRRDR